MSIDDLAYGIRSASILARIDATMVVADRMNRAVLGAGTEPFRLTAIAVGIADEIGRTLTDRIIRRSWNAYGRLVTGTRVTSFNGNAFYVRHWIRSKSWWALANGSMVVRDANSVCSAGIFVASIVARVR